MIIGSVEHVYFSATMFRRNIVEKVVGIESADMCQSECKNYRDEGCKYYVWKQSTNKCHLYNGLYGIEYDQDHNTYCLGHIDNCTGGFH